MLRLVFMGSDAIALPALEWLDGVEQVVGVFTQPDRAVGRGQLIRANAIKLWAENRGLPVFQPGKIGPAELTQLTALQPDLALVMAYGHILKPDFMAVPRLGTLNLHTSILPAYRGASPIQTAIANGETGTGVSLMRLVPTLDAGPVADVERVAIGPLDTAAEVAAGLAQACVPLLARCLPRIVTGEQTFASQDETKATYCRRLVKADGLLDFTRPAAGLAARINGLMPWPGCVVELNGQVVKLGLADAVDTTTNQPAGALVGADAEALLVGTGQGMLRLRKLQRPGGRMLPATEFLRGCPVALGTILPSSPMPVLVGPRPLTRPKG